MITIPSYIASSVTSATHRENSLLPVPDSRAIRSFFQPAADRLQFGRSVPEDLAPPSEAFEIKLSGGGRLHLRQWWPQGQAKPAVSGAQGPVVLLIHGLNGESIEMSPIVEELMKLPDFAEARFYGLDIPEIGQHPGVVSKITRVEDLNEQIREASRYLGQRHGRKIHAVGLSMGGFLLGNVAASNPPKELASVTLLSPAFKAHASRGSFRALIRIMFKALLAKLRGQKLPAILNGERTPASGIDFTPLQRAIMDAQARRRGDTGRLTLPSYYKLFWAMRKFRSVLAQNIKLPIQVFATEADNKVDLSAIRNAFRKFVADRKELIIFRNVTHNPILDPINTKISQSIGNFILGKSKRPAFGNCLSVIERDF